MSNLKKAIDFGFWKYPSSEENSKKVCPIGKHGRLEVKNVITKKTFYWPAALLECGHCALLGGARKKEQSRFQCLDCEHQLSELDNPGIFTKEIE